MVVATYQTLGVEGESDDASYLTRHYPENYFSHLIIDECHRSAWGQWSQVLTRNAAAVHIGLTATPRQLPEDVQATAGAQDDQQITADNLRYFCEPVYEYAMAQAMADGYLAACEFRTRKVLSLIHIYAGPHHPGAAGRRSAGCGAGPTAGASGTDGL